MLLEQEAGVMRRAIGYLCREIHAKLMYPLVHDLVTGDARVRVPAAITCRVLRFSTPG